MGYIHPQKGQHSRWVALQLLCKAPEVPVPPLEIYSGHPATRRYPTVGGPFLLCPSSEHWLLSVSSLDTTSARSLLGCPAPDNSDASLRPLFATAETPRAHPILQCHSLITPEFPWKSSLQLWCPWMFLGALLLLTTRQFWCCCAASFCSISWHLSSWVSSTW